MDMAFRLAFLWQGSIEQKKSLHEDPLTYARSSMTKKTGTRPPPGPTQQYGPHLWNLFVLCLCFTCGFLMLRVQLAITSYFGIMGLAIIALVLWIYDV